MFSTILLAVDASEHSRRATEAASDLAVRYGAAVTVVHVHEHESASVIDLESSDQARDCVVRAAGVLTANGVASRQVVLGAPRGRTADVVVERARQEEADLIVVGTRGMSDLASIVLGSVSHGVLRDAPCPVLICP